jgi:hypothetical protein
VSSIGVVVGPEPVSAPEEVAGGGAERGSAGAVRAAYQGLTDAKLACHQEAITQEQAARADRQG